MRLRRSARLAGKAACVASLVLAAACAGGAGPAAPAAGGTPPQEQDPPALIVFLVVDQLRGDLLQRYSGVFTGGFARLLKEGRVYSNALHDHAVTETSPGHAALSTGAQPARAGVPANGWREGEGSEARDVLNVIDPAEGLVGVPGLPGASPRVLRRTGLADWVLQANPRARLVSVSAKARAAVLMAGTTRGDVFWFEPKVGRFVTSTYYRPRNPSWLDRFNRQIMPIHLADTVWMSTVPEGAEGLSAPDPSPYEGDGVHTTFPHRFSQEGAGPGTAAFFLWFEKTPMLDRATLALARLAVGERELGRARGRTDFLSVSLSQTDRVGHDYGPLSREQMDNLLRLDRELGSFLAFLDKEVGEGRYLLGLTADHGVMTMPEREGARGTRLTLDDRLRLELLLNQAVQEGLGAGPRTASLLGDLVRELPFVGPVYTRDALGTGEPGDTILPLFRNSFVEGRGGGLLSPFGVEMWWGENVIDWGYPRGTTHGSPWFYDRWVPLILVAPGLPAGVAEERVRPLDLAPTLAALAGIPFPGDLDGRPLVARRE